MLANQKMRAIDGLEVALFPLEYLYMSQDEGGDFSHINTYNIDFLGYNENDRVYKCELYAPCTMKLIRFFSGLSSGNMCIFQSVNKVHLADGSIDYLTIMFAHDSNPPFQVLDSIVEQGEVIYHTGTYGNVTGDHVHTCAGKGEYQGLATREGGHEDLKNRVHYWNAVYTNSTKIKKGFNHSWHDYTGEIIPPSPPRTKGKGSFPWVLYARKLRNKSDEAYLS